MPGFDFDTFPTLETPRLILREFNPGDAADLFSYKSDPEVQNYDIEPVMREVSEAYKLIEKFREWFVAKDAIIWAIVPKEAIVPFGDNRVVGLLALMFWEHADYKADLGYSLARPYWRRGIATEGNRRVVQFAFETLRLHRINVDTRMDNIASVRLMAKLGFCHEGSRRECMRGEDGTYHTWGLFGMLEHEYWDSPCR